MGSGRGKQALIRQHSRRQHQQMLAQDEEISRRRNRKRLGTDAERKSLLLRRLKILYVPTVVFLCLGVAMVLGSVIQGLGEGTVFWEKKEQFHVVGPIILALGVIFLFISVGVITHVSNKERNKTIKELATKVGSGLAEEFIRSERKRSLYRLDSSSIPIMGYEEEEYYVNNVKPKPMDFREEEFRQNNRYELPVLKPLINHNNNYNMDFSDLLIRRPDNLHTESSSKKHNTSDRDHNAHSSSPLLRGLLDNGPTEVAAPEKNKPLDLSEPGLWKLPESVI